jgi:AraC-like DNA-binding protein
MILKYNTKLNGTIALTDEYYSQKELQREPGLYKFLWVRSGNVSVVVDHQKMSLSSNEVISLSHIQHLDLIKADGDYLMLVFNSNFYCIYGNDHEVSCSGFLFNGSSNLIRFSLRDDEYCILNEIADDLKHEFEVRDSLQEEMLRILLKRFIIECTRIARQRLDISQEKENSFEIVRHFYNLVDEHFKTKKQVQDYSELLNKSPKTLSNIFAICKLPSPLRVIHERVEAEAKRLLLYSDMSAKEIAYVLGFDDQATFSRFFKRMSGVSVTEYKKDDDGKN